ncbi:MAG: DUF1643 domain-containing protein [Gallionellaceae bacterium]|nr:DUF1643 domain-containing protein [Gallionellaceae bacterium]
MYDIYSNARDDHWRFTLGKCGSRKLFVIGLNPSTATQEKADTTVAKAERVAERNGYDGFVMLNLYPVRATNYHELPADVDREAYTMNQDRIVEIVSKESKPVIWAAWGESILARDYFMTAAADLIKRLGTYSPVWQHFGTMTATGHPRHPSRLQYAWSFARLDEKNYLSKLHS